MSVRVAHLINHDIGVRVHLRNYLMYLQDQGYEVHIACPPGAFVKGDMVTPEGMRIRVANFPPRYTPVQDLKTLMELVRYFRQQRFDIVHTHTVKPGLLGRVAAWFARVPIVIHTVHGFHIWDEMSGYERRLFLWIERLSARFCDLLLSQNHEDIAMAIREGICPADRISYLGNGIDISYFHPERVTAEQVAKLRWELGVAPNEHLVGMIGRLVRSKGYFDYMEAARVLRAQKEPSKFVTIGLATPEKADALSPEQLIVQYGLEGTMQHLGRRDDVRELIAAMDTVVLASYTEGVPRVLMEAAAMGKAAVGTDVRGTREVIVNGETGILVPARDPEALADGIRQLLRDKRRAREMGIAARRRAEMHFDERVFFWRTDIAYRRFLESKFPKKIAQGLRPMNPEALDLARLSQV